jgi:hypothetical protein
MVWPGEADGAPVAGPKRIDSTSKTVTDLVTPPTETTSVRASPLKSSPSSEVPSRMTIVSPART